ncbi:MAG: haloacid dehalogenase-like hydrolase [Candidatus Aureabacteria bacterium]|nr:haloacid dehalogenase-like hydrolase [Candidatus Auribacterota bacterium]
MRVPAPRKEKLALVFDFDDTLCPDSTNGFLTWCGVDTIGFWNTAHELIQEGFDPVLAYMNLMIRMSKTKHFAPLFTLSRFKSYARTIRFYQGVKTLFRDLKHDVKEFNPHVEIQYYLVSGGIDGILKSTVIAHEFCGIFSSAFYHDPKNGRILYPKRTVNFTDKTRFLFSISKGIKHEQDYFHDPSQVNQRLNTREYEIPFSRMIFVGDGFSDIPSFALLKKFGGYGIAVFDQAKYTIAKSLLTDERVICIAESDYSLKGQVRDAIKSCLRNILA